MKPCNGASRPAAQPRHGLNFVEEHEANLADKQHALKLASKAERARTSKPASAKRRREVQA